MNGRGALLLLTLWSESAWAGSVFYVTAEDAYLDMGRADGVAVGQRVTLMRGKRAVGTCEVKQVATRQARCSGGRPLPGDRFSLPQGTATDASLSNVASSPQAPRATERVPSRPALPTAEQQRRRRTFAEGIPLQPVVFLATPHPLAAHGGVTLRQQLWTTSTTPAGTTARSSLDASVSTGVGWGFAAASLRLVGDLWAPEQPRFRPDEPLELYVWRLSAGVSLGPVLGEVGRFSARRTAGTLLLDGAQVGVRMWGDLVEVGVYAGTLPDLLTLAPSAERLTAGSTVAADVPVAEQVLLLPRLRVGALSTGDLGVVRGDVEAQAQALWTGFGSVGVSSRVGVGADPAVSLDAAAADVDVLLLTSWRAFASWRFSQAPGFDFDDVGVVAPHNVTHHASLGTAFQALPSLSLGVVGGAGLDVRGDALRGWVGPEAGWTPTLGVLRAVEGGYIEEFGAWPGRSLWLGETLGFDMVRWTTRVSLSETEASVDAYREAGLTTAVDAPLLPWLTLQARLYGQQALPSLAGDKRRVPSTLLVDVSIGGVL